MGICVLFVGVFFVCFLCLFISGGYLFWLW